MGTSTPIIALVENDIATSVALGRLLRAQGFTVEIYRSGEEFFTRDGSSRLDCLLLDINLGGMSGLEVQRRIRAAKCVVPIIFMTGRDDARSARCAREQGCSGYLQKPFESPLLAEALDTALQVPVRPAGKSG